MPFDLDATTVRWDNRWFQRIVLYYPMQQFNCSNADMQFDILRPIRIPTFREGCKTSESLFGFFQPFRRIFILRKICCSVRHVGRSSLYGVEGKSAMKMPQLSIAP